MPLLVLFLLAVPAALSAQPAQFLRSEECSLCHAEIRSGGALVAQHPLWSGSMMANSAIDPYFRAKLASETAANPAARGVIENKCLSCHAPMQQYPLRAQGKLLALAGLDDLGADGVSCTLCHQVRADGLGTTKSFSGGFVIGTGRELYGPHPDPFPMPMLHHTGFTPVLGSHIREAALCGTCHTVITPTLDAAGNVLGEFVEQAPFLEWLASGYPASGTTCQSCHVPLLKDAAGKERSEYIAHRPPGGPFPPTSPRAPFGLHRFAGGNYQVAAVIAEQFPERAAEVHAAAAAVREQLESAVSLELNGKLDGSTLKVAVTVANRTGHKLPTGFPSRRLWLRVVVSDSAGAKLFESGAWDTATGEIEGGGVQPHRTRITSPEQVLIYEAEMADPSGDRTLSLMRAGRWLKDNRILPAGFDAAKGARVAPAGVEKDADFASGSDRVEYLVPIAAARPPFRVRVEALYQNLKPSHLASLADGDFRRRMVAHLAPLSLASVERRFAPTK